VAIIHEPELRRPPGPEALGSAAPVDIACLGIGVNGHLAFNDPPGDLGDRALARIVELDDVSRRQQTPCEPSCG
jgi:6-phosphogluconolactonase/glucosamine-6-phosphate isomerase/deaminase